MIQSIPRRLFELVRQRRIEARMRRELPDARWRQACLSSRVPFSAVRLEADKSLTVHFSRSSLTLPQTDTGEAILSAYRILENLSRTTDCTFRWNAEGGHLDIASGQALYAVDCFEEAFIVGELYLAGDYDFRAMGQCVVLDIGANVGFSSIFMAYADPGIQIEAYEPLAKNYARALRNFAANPAVKGRINIHNFGLFSTDADKEISTEQSRPGRSSIVIDRKPDGPENVRVETIAVRRASAIVESVVDKYPFRKLVVKMDCEGSEYEILGELAASGQLKKIDFMVMEWHRVTGAADEIDNLRSALLEWGFNVYFRGRLSTMDPAGMAVCWRAH